MALNMLGSNTEALGDVDRVLSPLPGHPSILDTRTHVLAVLTGGDGADADWRWARMREGWSIIG